MTIHLFLYVLGLVFLFLAGLKVPEHPRVNYGWLGMFFLFLAPIVKV